MLYMPLIRALGIIVVWLLLSCRGPVDGGGRAADSAGRSSPATITDGPDSGAGPEKVFVGSSEVEIPSDPTKLAAELEQRETQYLNEKKELATSLRVSQALCTRLSAIRRSCAGKKPITSGAWMHELDCHGRYARTRSKAKVEVAVTAPAGGSFWLRLNDTYESRLLSPGTSSLVFDSLANDSSPVPLFEDIMKAELIVEHPGDAVGGATGQLQILVDGSPLLSQAFRGLRTMGRQAINTQSLYHERISERCHTTREALDLLIRKAAAGGGSSYPSDGFVDAAGMPQPLPVRSAGGRREMKERYIAALRNLQQISPEIEGLRNRILKLKNEILSDSGAGCHLQQDIKSLRLTIEGNQIREDVAKKSGRQRTGHGDSEVLSISLGGGIGFSTANFIGTLVPAADFKGKKIAAISQLKLEKMGVYFDNVSRSCGVSTIESLFKNDTCYDIYEENVMTINSITLEVNGMILLQKNNLGVKLNRRHTAWQISDLAVSNHYWAQMLQNTNCTLVE